MPQSPVPAAAINPTDASDFTVLIVDDNEQNLELVLEVAQAVRARKASDVLPKLFADLRMDQRQAEAEIVRVWQSLIDPTLVAHAQPVGVRNGTLFVVVDSSVWLSEIVRYRRKEILDRLQHSFGPTLIRQISYRVG